MDQIKSYEVELFGALDEYQRAGERELGCLMAEVLSKKLTQTLPTNLGQIIEREK